MDFIKEDILSGELIPVLLGISPEAVETARRLHRQYGVVSHIFCDRIPLSVYFSVCMKYHIVRHTEKEALMLEALSDFAKQLGNADVILYLIPCTEPYVSLMWEHQEQLERSYILANPQEMRRVWFGEEEDSREVPDAE